MMYINRVRTPGYSPAVLFESAPPPYDKAECDSSLRSPADAGRLQ